MVANVRSPHQWGRPAKGALAVASVWPAVYFAVFVIALVAFGLAGSAPPIDSLLAILSALVWLTLATMGLLLVAYAFDIVKNPRVQGGLKAVWAVLFFVAPIISMPLYWYLYVREVASGERLLSSPGACA